MNISITNLCNRRCQYCFQRGWYLSDKAYYDQSVTEMSLDQLEDILQWVNHKAKLSIMGGEPLMHSQIHDVMRRMSAYSTRRCLIISNISISNNKFTSLPWTDGFEVLANIDWRAQQQNDFLDNLEYLYTNNINVSLSTTITPQFDLNEYHNRLDECLKRHPKIMSLRISTACPTPNIIYTPRSYDNLLIQFFSRISVYGIPIVTDCQIPQYELSSQTRRLLRMRGMLFNCVHSCYCNPPIDILVNGDIVWCSSCQHIRTNYKKHSSIDQALQYMQDQLRQKFGTDCWNVVCFAKQERMNNV